MARKHPLITLLHKPNGGQSSARNFGVAHSKSALIALLDQDDYWYPDHLEKLRQPYKKDRHGKVGWVYSDLDRINEAGNLFCRRFLSTLGTVHPKEHIYGCLQEDMFILPSASLISRTAFESVHGFDERLVGYEDDDLFLRMFRTSWQNVFIQTPLSAWRIFPSSTSYTTRMTKSRMIYLDKLIQLFPDERKNLVFYVRDLIAPRFTRTLLAEIYIASQEPDWPRVQRNAADLWVAAARLPLRARIVIRSVAMMLRIQRLARPTMTAMFLARRFLPPSARWPG
jgi:glycosyltransferase involved in cell wall biosynthesis